MVLSTPPNARASYTRKKDALRDLRSRQDDGQGILIQASSVYYAYDNAENLEADLSVLQTRTGVREIVRADYKRRPFADIDHVDEHQHAECLAKFNEIFDCNGQVFTTGHGIHIVAQDDKWISLREHKELLVKLSRAIPETDVAAVHSLRLAGCYKEYSDGSRLYKQLPPGWRLRAALCQPDVNKPRDVVYNPEHDPAADCVDVTPDDIAHINILLTNTPDAFTHGGISDGRLQLHRQRPSHCNICKKTHDASHAIVYMNRGSYASFVCCPRAAQYVAIKGDRHIKNTYNWNIIDHKKERTVADRLQDVGPLNTRSFADVDDIGAEATDNIRRGSYVDGSPCGAGKSVEFWSTVTANQSIVAVSYRKAFTLDIVTKYSLEQYDNLIGQINITEHKRLAVQADSLHRVTGTPNILLLDELRGIARHMLDGQQTHSQMRSMPALFDMMRRVHASGGRVVVLDALADDQTHAWVEATLNASVPAITCKPVVERAKGLVILHNHKELEGLMYTRMMAMADKPVEARDKMAVYTHIKGTPGRKSSTVSADRVASLAKSAGLRVLTITGDTSAADRAALFGNLEKMVDDHDVIVHTSALEAGVSISDPRFKVSWLFSAQLGHVESTWQALNRWRSTRHVFAAFALPYRYDQGPTTLKGLCIDLQAGADYSGYSADDLDTPEGMLWAQVRLERNRSAAHHIGRLASIFTQAGGKIRIAGDVQNQLIAPIPKREELPQGLDINMLEVVACVNYNDYDHHVVEESGQGLGDHVELKKHMFLCSHYGVTHMDESFISKYQTAEWVHRRSVYKHIVGGYNLPRSDRSINTDSDHERIQRINDVLTDIGLGTLYTPKQAPSAAITKFDHGSIVELYDNHKRLFPGMRLRQRPTSKRQLTTMISSMITSLCGAAIVNSDRKHPDRGIYGIVHHWTDVVHKTKIHLTMPAPVLGTHQLTTTHDTLACMTAAV